MPAPSLVFGILAVSATPMPTRSICIVVTVLVIREPGYGCGRRDVRSSGRRADCGGMISRSTWGLNEDLLVPRLGDGETTRLVGVPRGCNLAIVLTGKDEIVPGAVSDGRA